MDGFNGSYCFHLNNHRRIDHEIDAVGLVQSQALVAQSYGDLSLETKPTKHQHIRITPADTPPTPHAAYR